MTERLHIAPVLPAHFIQSLGYLAERAMPNRVHQFGKNILIVKRCIFDPF